jgi:hypothetical protein
MDVAKLRSQFPVTEHMVFLNNAAESPLCLPVRRRLDAYLDLAARSPGGRWTRLRCLLPASGV